jgi:uncharacterized protein with PQ loop repeat
MRKTNDFNINLMIFILPSFSFLIWEIYAVIPFGNLETIVMNGSPLNWPLLPIPHHMIGMI